MENFLNHFHYIVLDCVPTQDGLTSEMRVNGKFLASRWVTLYRSLFRNHTTYSISNEIQDGCYWLICVRKRHESNQGCLQWRFKKYYVFREDTCPLIFLSLLPLAFHYVLNTVRIAYNAAKKSRRNPRIVLSVPPPIRSNLLWENQFCHQILPIAFYQVAS